MINTLLTFAAFVALETTPANEDIIFKKEAKIINEILVNLEQPLFPTLEIVKSKTISVYTPEGKLLHEFTEENYDAKALRNVDFLLEDASSKIFIKYRN